MLSGNKLPFWFMRQAGRYMAEYRALRSKLQSSGYSFLDMCYDPEIASEITMQPINAFDIPIAIIFSDILTIPDAMGLGVKFIENIGPVLNTIKSKNELSAIDYTRKDWIFNQVENAIKFTKTKLPKNKHLIGFSGSPFTLACYIINGGSSADGFSSVKEIIKQDIEFVHNIIEILTDLVCEYSAGQIDAGIDAIQFFDSHAGILNDKDFDDFVITPNKTIVDFVKKRTNIPVICFPRGAGANYFKFCDAVSPDIISLDQSIPLDLCFANIDKSIAFQGNLNNELLEKGSIEEILESAKSIIKECDKNNRKLIFNLSHGIIKTTPVENVAALSRFLIAQNA